MSRAERRAMVERMNPPLPISQQCRLLALPRSSVFRKPAEDSAEALAIMALIDRHYLARPYYGSPPVGGGVGAPRPSGQPQAGAAPDAAAGPGGDLPAPEYEQAGGGAQDLSLPAARARDRAGQSGLVLRRYLHPDGQGLSLPGGDHGLGEPRGAGLAPLQHARRRFLRRGARGSALALWSAENLQYLPRQPVHQ